MTDKKPVHNEEFSWTVHDFSRPKKAVEEVKMEWPKEPERPRRSVNLDEPISFDIDVFKKRSESEPLPKAEEPKAPAAASPEQKIQELTELTEKLRKQQNAERQAAAQKAMNSSRQEAAAEAKEESLRKADPFFDFSQTNIAFQDLLDQEYAKLQKRKEGVPYVESQWRYQPNAVEEPTPAVVEEPTPAVVEEVPEPAVTEAPEVPELPESPEDALERMLMEDTKSFDPDSDATIQVDLSAIKKAAAQRYGYEEGAEAEPAVVEEPVPVVKAVEEIVTETAPETPEEAAKKRNTMTEMERAREEYFKMLDQEIGGVQVKVEVGIKPGAAVERHTTILKASDIQTAEAAAEAAVVAGATTAAVEEPPKKEEPVPVSEPQPKTKDEEIVWPLDPREYEEEEERGGFFSLLGKILLFIIAIVIALEIGALAILYFAPDSSIGATVKDVQGQILDFVESIKDGNEDDANDPVTDPDGGQNEPAGEVGGEAGGEEQPLVMDPKPMTDKAKLIQTQMDRNENIKSIKANSALAFKSGVDYGLEDLNKSQPIENNIWYTDDNGTPVYYDQEVVGALIAFNSQWIDYVNEGDKAVLKLTKEGSDAYNNAVNFSKAGKVTEEFESVEIGEIRQGEQGFYLWVGEKIHLTEGGATSTAEYQWVYCMEPVGSEMQITDYINVKNK